MRISIIDPSLFTLPYDRALARGLASAGHQVTLHGRRLGADDNGAAGINLLADFYRVAGSRAVAALPRLARLGIKGVDHAWSMTQLLRRLRRSRPDVIHFQWLALPLVDGALLAAFQRIAPLVLTVHDTDPFNGDPTSGLQQHGFARCLATFDRLIVHTAQGQARLLQRGIPADRLIMLPHGLLTQPTLAPADPMTGPLTFLLFGKVKPYKGVDVMIEAFARLPPALQSQAEVRVVGKPYMDMAPLHALATSRGVGRRISFEQRFVHDDEVDALFGPGAVAVFPYREIEASGVLFLALAHGRPVIASDLGSFSDTVTDGVHGHLVPADDIAALTDALAHVIADRGFAASCASSARSLADAVPSWDEIGQRTAGAYAAAGARIAAA
jgi:glycosyltransferase involved in cell wall biosynthesis